MAWLDRAYQKAAQINQVLLKPLAVTEVQLDEMWNFVKRKLSEKAADKRESQQEAKDGQRAVRAL